MEHDRVVIVILPGLADHDEPGHQISDECGPATLMTIAALISSPVAVVTPATR